MGGGAVRIDRLAGLSTVIGSLPAPLQAVSPRFLSTAAVELDASHLEVRVDPTDGLEGLDAAPQEVVVPLTGPVTLGLDLGRHGRSPEEAAALAVTTVQRVGHQVVAWVQRRFPEVTPVVFLEEPALVNSMHPTFPLGPAQVESILAEVVGGLSGSALVGLRVPGRADWSLLLRTGIGALAAPITAHLETASTELGRFLKSGGIMVWGAVPTDEPLGMSADRLWRRLVALWGELVRRGLDPVLLRDRSIIAPVAELGAFGASQAERVLNLSQNLAARLLHQSPPARRSLGA